MGTVKAAIGYGIGLVVVGAILAYLISRSLKVRRDKFQQLARKDSERLKLSDSADYGRTFLGPPVHPTYSKEKDRSTERVDGSHDQTSDGDEA